MCLKKEKLTQKQIEQKLVIAKEKIDNLEKEIKLKEREIYSLFEITNDAKFIFDLEGNFLKVNQNAADLFGFDKNKIDGIKAIDFITSDEQSDSNSRLSELLSGKTLPIYERKFKKSSGEEFYAEVNLSLIKDIDGINSYIQSIIRDISSRKKIDKAIKRDRQVFQNIALKALESTNLKDFCNYVLQYLLDNLGFEFGTLRIIDESKQFLLPLAIIGLPNNLVSELKPIMLTEDEYFIVSYVIKNKKPLFAPDAYKLEELKPYRDRLKIFNIQSLISWPILNKSKEIIGALQLSATKVKNLINEDKAFFESIASILSIALEKQLTERALEQAHDEREELNKIINLSPAFVFLWRNEKDFPVDYVSDNITIFGYSPEDFYSRKINYNDIILLDLFNEGFKEEKNLANLRINNCAQPTEYKLITKSGETRWVIEYVSPRFNSNGEITHFHGIVLDITSRKQVEETIKRERLSFKVLVETTLGTNNIAEFCKNVLREFTEPFGFTYGICRLYNHNDRTLERIAHINITDVYQPLEPIISIDREDLFHTLVARNKKPIFIPNTKLSSISDDTRKKLEGLKIVSFITWPILNYKNDLLGVIQLVSEKEVEFIEKDYSFFESIFGFISTAIDKIKTEQELKHSEERFRETVDNMNDGLIIVENGEIVYANDQAIRIAGFPKEEFMKFRGFSNVAPEEAERYKQEVDLIVQNQISYSELEYWLLQKNGNKRYVMSRHHIKYTDGKPLDMFILTSDLTDKKLAEENLKRLNDELEKRVEERTEQLEILNKELEAFSYSASHDLRTPLRSIDGFSQALAEDYSERLDSFGKDYINRIRTSVKRMSVLIDDLLSLSKLSKSELSLIHFNLSEMISEVVNEFRNNEPERNVITFIQDNLVVYADSILIRTVIENLIGNAWKFTNKRTEAKIEFGSTIINDEKVFFIRDNGIGFDQLYSEKLFEVFQRLHSYQEFPGTGIGLAIVQRIITRHNGKVWAEGEVDKGATFYFTLHTKQKTEN